MRHWACGRTSCRSSLLPSWRASWASPPGKGLSPAAEIERTLTEDARPSKALSLGGAPRPPRATTELGSLSSPLGPRDTQDAGPLTPQQHRRPRGHGRREPLARLLLRGEHQRLAAGGEQAFHLEQL